MSKATEKKSMATKAELALAVADRVELTSIRMAEFSARCPTAIDPNELPEAISVSGQTESEAHGDGKWLSVKVRMQVHVSKPGDPVENAPVNVQAVFEIRYELKDSEGLTKDHYDAFAESNAVFNAWPYWREYVQSATMRLGLPGLTLPLFRLSRVSRPNKK